MKKPLILTGICGALISMSAIAADPYERYLTIESQRGTEIEMIRVASKKPLASIAESDAEVADILEELDALEEDIAEMEDEEKSE